MKDHATDFVENPVSAVQNATQNVPVRKNEGSLFKNQPAGTPSEQTISNALDNVGKLVARVLDDLKSASSLSRAEQILSQAKDTKIAPNLASELSDLAKSLEAEAAQNESPEIKSLALKLKEFLKPIADLKAGSLNDQIKNSGVMLEANLKDALTPEKLPSSIQKLLSDIKNLSNQNLLSQILTLNDESLDNQNSFMKLTSMLEKASGDTKNLLDNSSIKTLLKDVDKLDNVAKFLDKNFSKEQSADAVKSQIGKMENFIKEGKGGFDFAAVSSHSKVVNANRMRLHMLAYNLFNWFRRLVLPANMRKQQIYVNNSKLNS